MKGRLYVLMFGLAAAVACGSPEPTDQHSPAIETLALAVETVQPSEVPLTLELMGTTEARTEATVAARLMAQIEAVAVQVGDRVRQGQLLFALDSSDVAARLKAAEAAREQAVSSVAEAERALEAAEAGLASAEAQARLATTTFERFQALHERGSASPQEFDEARSRRDSARGEVARAAAMVESIRARQNQAESGRRRAEAEIEQARTLIGFTQIRAPFAGVVTAKTAQVGDLAAPGAALLRLEAMDGFRLALDVPESQLAHLNLGQKLRVDVSALDLQLEAQVSEIQPGGDPLQRTFRVKLDLPAEARMRSGLFGRVHLAIGSDNLLTIPDSALLRRGQLDGAFVVDPQGVARFRLLELGRQVEGRREVVSGLAAGEVVVTAPPPDLRDGTPVTGR